MNQLSTQPDSQRYPRGFKLGTTSFIYPDHILPNVEKLGPEFDEIELLVFESLPDAVVPSETDVDALVRLSRSLDLSYNVHLPVDVSLTDPDPAARSLAAERIRSVIRRFAPAPVSTHTLHLDFSEPDHSRRSIAEWQERVMKTMGRLEQAKICLDTLSVETLDYPYSYLEPVLDRFNLQVCLDIGHMIRDGNDFTALFRQYLNRIAVIHLHGVDRSGPVTRDHVSLDRLPAAVLNEIVRLLQSYRGVVSLEVFSRTGLDRSLTVLNRFFHTSG